MLKINQNKGFQITFENGYTVSVQFGYANYCEGRSFGSYDHERKNDDGAESPDAEMAVWDKEGKWVRPTSDWTNDDVIGWIKPNDVLRIMNVVANL